MAKKKESEVSVVALPQLKIRDLYITIVGDSPLVLHAWSEKAKKQIKDKQAGVAKKGRAKRDPADDYAQCFYIIDERPGDRDRIKEGDFEGIQIGFPSVAIKKAIVASCRNLAGIKMTEARSMFHVVDELVPIIGSDPEMREDMVSVGMTTDIRYRPMIKEWKIPIRIQFNEEAVSAEQIMGMANIGGFGNGIGEWRPEKNGQMGRFHVAMEDEQ